VTEPKFNTQLLAICRAMAPANQEAQKVKKQKYQRIC